MKTHKYHVLLANMIDNALLHLYGRVSATSRYVPVVNRNEILVRYLKSKSKLASYKSIKHELDTMLRIARSKEGNLEVKLQELRLLANKHRKDVSAAHVLFRLFESLHVDYGFDSKLVNDKQPILPEIIYILADHIEHCFSDEGKQIAPVSLLIETTRLTVLLNAIERYPAFSYELHEWNEQTKQAHILLHPQP